MVSPATTNACYRLKTEVVVATTSVMAETMAVNMHPYSCSLTEVATVPTVVGTVTIQMRPYVCNCMGLSTEVKLWWLHVDISKRRGWLLLLNMWL